MANMTHWTEQEIYILKTMSDAGKRAEEIHKVLQSRTIEAINNKASQFGLSLSGKPRVDLAAFKEIMKGMEVKCL